MTLITRAYSLKRWVRNTILIDQQLKGAIATIVNRDTQTVYRWAKNNSPELTMLGVLECIQAHLKTDEPLVEEREIH